MHIAQACNDIRIYVRAPGTVSRHSGKKVRKQEMVTARSVPVLTNTHTQKSSCLS